MDCTYITNFNEYDNCVPARFYYEEITHEDVINLMGNAYPCSEHFLTPGQGIYMRETLAGLSNTVFANVFTDLASLYEPYSGGYYTGGPSMPSPALFQPGFDYRFVECDCACPQPIPYHDTNFTYTSNSVLTISKYETNYNLIYHPNHTAIYIDLGPICDYYDPEDPRRCYDNDGIPFAGGFVTKFNDGVFNNNVTITPKDSTAINDANLVNDLQPGLYKIEKNDHHGGTEENIVIKENQ